MAEEGAAEPANWRPIIETVPQVLASMSKDLEITAYFIEALVRENGFAGLRDGFRLARELVAQFGDDIYPLPDEDGDETRLAPLTGLNGEGGDGTLIAPVMNIPLTDNTSVGAFGQAHYVQAQDLERSPEEARERRISQGAVSMETFGIAVAETSPEFFRNLLDDIEDTIEQFGQFGATLDEKYGQSAPPTSNIQHTLDACKETVEKVARDKLAMLVPQESELTGEGAEDASGAEPGAAAGEPKAVVGEIRTREDAFREILGIADYFRRTEPHSPISYALEQIVRWGRLPLPDLLRELISDESSVSQMFRLVGIQPTSDTDME
jgi:type VI secretion system protein ImpA